MKSLLLLISLLSYSSVHAAIGFEDAVFPELATSSRALAMGNAFISKVDDASAAFYNPAGLGTVRYGHLHISNFQFESNKGWLKSAGGGSATDAFGNFAKAFSLDGTRELLLDNKGQISHARFHALPNLTTRYFSMGYLISLRQRATIGTESGAEFEYAKRRDHGPYVALNLSLFGGVFKFGVSTIWLHRKEAIGTAPADQTIELEDSDHNFGSAIIMTGGAKLTLPVTFLPTFSIVSHNLGQQPFSSGRGAGVPDPIRNTIDLGFSVTPQIGKKTRVHLEANLKDSTLQYSDVGTARRLTLGMELDFSRIFFMRLGYGDGFGSGGIGIRTKKLEFDLTTYAVDTTTSEYRGEEDRRFVIGFSSGF